MCEGGVIVDLTQISGYVQVYGKAPFRRLQTLLGSALRKSVCTHTHTHTHTYIYIYIYAYTQVPSTDIAPLFVHRNLWQLIDMLHILANFCSRTSVGAKWGFECMYPCILYSFFIVHLCKPISMPKNLKIRVDCVFCFQMSVGTRKILVSETQQKFSMKMANAWSKVQFHGNW